MRIVRWSIGMVVLAAVPLAAAIEGDQLHERTVVRHEKAWPIFPALDYRVYSSWIH